MLKREITSFKFEEYMKKFSNLIFDKLDHLSIGLSSWLNFY